jgi:hypothetical protein
MSQQTRPTPQRDARAHDSRRLPTLVGVEGDAYVFVAVIEDPTLDGGQNWLMQTFHVDPTDADDGLSVRVTERYHVGGRERHVAFEDRFGLRIPVEQTDAPRQVETVRRALERWYRRAYPGDGGFPSHSPDG